MLGAGGVGAVFGMMVWIFVETVVMALVFLPQLKSAGSGGIAAVSGGLLSPPLLLAAAGGFVLGMRSYHQRSRLDAAPDRQSP